MSHDYEPQNMVACTECGTVRERDGDECQVCVLRELMRYGGISDHQLRYEWWSNHGHDGLYGDDGEMQCSVCGADFLRDPLMDLQAKVYLARLKRLGAVLERKGWLAMLKSWEFWAAFVIVFVVSLFLTSAWLDRNR